MRWSISGFPSARSIDLRTAGRVSSEAFRQGHRGTALAVVLLGRPWGFDLQDVVVPVLLLRGEADMLVPPAMGRHMPSRSLTVTRASSPAKATFSSSATWRRSSASLGPEY